MYIRDKKELTNGQFEFINKTKFALFFVIPYAMFVLFMSFERLYPYNLVFLIPLILYFIFGRRLEWNMFKWKNFVLFEEFQSICHIVSCVLFPLCSLIFIVLVAVAKVL